MKTITVVIPTFNEEENVPIIYERVHKVFESKLSGYRLEYLFIDNFSTDNTRAILRKLAEKDKSVKVILNARNFGFSRSTFYGLTKASGDCAVLVFADMQDPPEVIPQMVDEWENGYKVVCGIKNKSRESPVMYAIRSVYYKLLKKICEVDHIEHFDGFGLYDSSFIKVLNGLSDSMPYLRGIVSELGYRIAYVKYEQDIRKNGKSAFNFLKMYDLAMLGITSYSKAVMRIAVFFGCGIGMISFFIAFFTVIKKLLFWDSYPMGSAAIITGIFFFFGIQSFFIGMLGEYIANINTRIMNRPLVVEEDRLNMDADNSPIQNK